MPTVGHRRFECYTRVRDEAARNIQPARSGQAFNVDVRRYPHPSQYNPRCYNPQAQSYQPARNPSQPQYNRNLPRTNATSASASYPPQNFGNRNMQPAFPPQENQRHM